MWRSRLGWAALASLLLHAMLLAWLWRGASAPRAPGSQRPAPLVVDIVVAPAKPAPAAPEPAEPAPPEPKRPRPSPPLASPPVAKKPAPPAPPAPPPVDSAQAAAPSADAPRAPDAPRTPGEKPSLLPTAPNGGWSLPTAPEGPRGRTLRPGDPSLSPEALAAEEQGRVGGRLKGFVDDDLARLRVENGVVHPYFGRLRAALEKQLVDAPLFGTPSTLQHLARTYRDEAGRFGATGTPGGRGPGVPAATERLDALTRGDTGYDGLRARARAGEQLQKFAEGNRETGLVVTLELVQGPDGALQSARVVDTSGNKAFDAWVLERVPPSLAPLAPPPAGAPGVRPEGIRSLWAVEGRVIYLKKLRDMKGEDAWYTATMAAAGVLAGTFEETTGDVYVIDLRNPRFVVRPRLLRVY